MSAAVDAQGLDPLIHRGLQKAGNLILLFLFSMLVGSGKSAAPHTESGVSFIEEKEDQCPILALFLQVFRIMDFLSLHHHPEHNH